MTLRIQIGGWGGLKVWAEPIRLAVFVDEQQVPLALEWDEFDAVSLHAIAWVGEMAVGTARLLPDGHIGRLAVLQPYRGRGVGSALMRTMIEAGQGALVLHAQCHAVGFYEKLGFTVQGPPFMEAGILHVEMVKEG